MATTRSAFSIFSTARVRARPRTGVFITTCPTIVMTAASTDPHTVRVTFPTPIRRVPPLSSPLMWAVRTPGGADMTIASVTPEAGVGPVSYVDIETVEEQAASPATPSVELYTVEEG